MLSPRRYRQVRALLASLLMGLTATTAPARAAELLEIRLEGLVLPVSISQLEEWVRAPAERSGAPPPSAGADLGIWLNLLSPVTQRDLRQLLRSPLLRERSFGRQLLDSWAGRQVLEEVGTLLTRPDGSRTAAEIGTTVQRLLQQQPEVTAMDLLRELPEPRLSLQLDAVLLMAGQWRQQLALQSRALQGLQRLGLPERSAERPLLRLLAEPGPPPAKATTRRTAAWPTPGIPEQRLTLPVPHRSQPLPLALWPAAPAGADAAPAPWVLLLPGLGGDIDQLSWLAQGLARRGWSVLAVQHTGSDGAALRAALQGQRPPPGGETLALRLADIEAVLAAQRSGRLPIRGEGVVLLGHSLGAVTALLAAGLTPEPGLEPRCRRALERLPFTNPSRLLQCQLPAAPRRRGLALPNELRAVVGLNPFGSLLWPRQGLAGLSVPLLLAGGSLDLVTPPLEEQLGLFLPGANPRDRLVVVKGGSHFSPVHVADDNTVLFRLGDELVGVAPAVVQELLLQLTGEFLSGLGTSARPSPPPPQRRSLDGVTAFVLDPAAARRWQRDLRP